MTAAEREWRREVPTVPETYVRLADLVFGPQCDSPPNVYRVVLHDSSIPPHVKRVRVVALTPESAMRRVERAVELAKYSVVSIEEVN